MKFKLGCDPEIFLQNAHGKLMASCGLIGGTKQEPMPLPIGEGFCVQEDNVALEFNIPPAENAKEFVDYIGRTLGFLTDGVKSRYGFTLSTLSAASFDKDQLVSRAAREFGCDPDYNAWTMRRNPKPKADDETLRSCGGHIHVGFDKSKLDGIKLMRMMDFYLGVPSVLMDEGEKRKLLYGKRGAYREKGYGFEYRTLSNFWVMKDRLVQWAWDNTERAIQAVESQFPVEDYDDSILDAIDNNNKQTAERLVKTFNLEVVSV